MNPIIFESRQLQSDKNNLTLSVNVDAYGGFYALSIYPSEYSKSKFEADNETWILETLFPALEKFVYEGTYLSEDLQKEIGEVSREELITIYEMLVRASSLGWIRKNA